MSLPLNWVQAPAAKALGLTLAHFVWEGAAIGLVLAAVLRRAGRRATIRAPAAHGGDACAGRLAGAPRPPSPTAAGVAARGADGILPSGGAGGHRLLSAGDSAAHRSAHGARCAAGGSYSDSRIGSRPAVRLPGEPAAEIRGGAVVLSPGGLVGVGRDSRGA